MAADKTVTFGIKIDAESNTDDAASSIEEFRKRITSSQDAVKSYGSSLRNLKGSTDAVKSAKEQLKAAINAEKDKISQATLALGKHGVTVTDVATRAKEATARMGALKNVVGQIGGPAAEASGKFEALSSVLTADIGIVGAFTVATVAAVAAVTAFAVATGYAAFSLAKFILTSGDFLRTQNLISEGTSGSAANAKAMGEQMDLLSSKIPMPMDKLRELGNELSRTFNGARIKDSGQAWVDTMNAVGKVTSANGDIAGNTIKDIMTRGRMLGRMGISVNELQTTGLKFQDVVLNMSKNMGISLKASQSLLVSYRAPHAAAAKALNQAIEQQFGDLNKRKLLALDVQAERFKNTLMKLTKDINLTPILEGIARLANMFDVSTQSGKTLKLQLEGLGKIMTAIFVNSLPYVQIFFNQIIIETQNLEIAFLDLALRVKRDFPELFQALKNGFAEDGDAVKAAHLAFKSFEVVLGTVGVGLAFVAAQAYVTYHAVKLLIDTIGGLGKNMMTVAKTGDGSHIVDGLIDGIKSRGAAAFHAVATLAKGINTVFSDNMEIKSPSKLFERHGKNTVEGFVQGVEKSSGNAEGAVSGMIPGGGGGGSIKMGGGGTNNSFSITIHVDGGGQSGSDIQNTLTGPSFRAQFTKMLEEIMVGAGMPTQTPQGGVT